ncbi:MAG TPA: hypothetical protein VIT91_03420 [Chthoniobacterales bacterium]
MKDSTRASQHLRSFLNEHSLRLPKGFPLCRPFAIERLLTLKAWTPVQKVLLQEMHGNLIAARERRQRLRRMMALEIDAHPDLLRLYSRAAREAARQPGRRPARRAVKPGGETGNRTGLNLITTYAVIAVVATLGALPRARTSSPTWDSTPAWWNRCPRRGLRWTAARQPVG